jgi:anti-sigma28 factor (negative regulator of flagellin synthesis)
VYFFNKANKQKQGVSISSQGDTSKVQQIQDAIESGEYQVNLQALSEKIAEELL